MTNDLPNSSIVHDREVPRIAIWLDGVLRTKFSLAILFRLPVINLAVPLAKLSASLDLFGFGSKIYSSMTRLLCSVSLTTDSSRNSIAILPALVCTLSFCSIPNSSSAWYALSLTTCALPLSSETSPISRARSGSATVRLNNTDSTVIAT